MAIRALDFDMFLLVVREAPAPGPVFRLLDGEDTVFACLRRIEEESDREHGDSARDKQRPQAADCKLQNAGSGFSLDPADLQSAVFNSQNFQFPSRLGPVAFVASHRRLVALSQSLFVRCPMAADAQIMKGAL